METLKKYIEYKSRLQDILVNCRKKVKELEEKLKHASLVASEKLETSRQDKREHKKILV